MYFLEGVINLATHSRTALCLIIALYLMWGFTKMVLYNKLMVKNSWIAFIPILSNKPILEIASLNPLCLCVIAVPFIGYYFYNILIVYSIYKFLKTLGHKESFCLVGMFLIYPVIFYEAFFNNRFLKCYRRKVKSI